MITRYEPWTGFVVGLMHTYGITNDEIANILGWSKGYISMLLHGQRKVDDARRKIFAALSEAITRRESGYEESGNADN